MTKVQAINYVKCSLDTKTFKAIKEEMKTNKASVINYLAQIGIREEVLNLL